MTRPLVTIMIPTCNQHQMIARAVNSAISQTYRPLEIIVSDDSENELTYDQIVPWLTEGVKYFHHKPALGRVQNYHHLLYNLAQGEWVLNLDGDDYLKDKTFIEKAIQHIDAYPDTVMVFANQVLYHTATKKFTIFRSFFRPGPRINGNTLILNMVFGNVEVPHLATLYNRRLALLLDFYTSDILSTDRESLIRLMLNHDIGYLDLDAGVWVQHERNASKQYSIHEVLANTKMYDRLGGYIRENGDISLFVLKLWAMLGKYKLYHAALRHYIRDSRFMALKAIRCFVRADPWVLWLVFVDPRSYFMLLNKVVMKYERPGIK